MIASKKTNAEARCANKKILPHPYTQIIICKLVFTSVFAYNMSVNLVGLLLKSKSFTLANKHVNIKNLRENNGAVKSIFIQVSIIKQYCN